MSDNSATRHHLGTGSLELKRELSVFINCPFDDEFKPIFDAVVSATLCCGFLPRCAIESGTASISRMDRIVGAMRASKYSIHDLSRCRGDGECNLARFNMPLELGMAMAERYNGSTNYGHDWLVLVPRGHQYKQFISDLSGFDPSEYDETVASAIPTVMGWLATRPDAVRTPTPQRVLEVLPDFQVARARLCAEWRGCEPWSDLLVEGLRIATSSDLIPQAGS